MVNEWCQDKNLHWTNICNTTCHLFGKYLILQCIFFVVIIFRSLYQSFHHIFVNIMPNLVRRYDYKSYFYSILCSFNNFSYLLYPRYSGDIYLLMKTEIVRKLMLGIPPHSIPSFCQNLHNECNCTLLFSKYLVFLMY